MIGERAAQLLRRQPRRPCHVGRDRRTPTVGFDTTGDGGRTWQQQAFLPATVQQPLPWPIFARYPSFAVASPKTWWLTSPFNPVHVEVTVDAGQHWRSVPAAGLPVAPDALHEGDCPWGARRPTRLGHPGIG